MENAERLLCGSRRLQSGYLQSQDGDYTPLSRNLLGATQQCCEPLQCKWISQLGQIDAYQRQIGDFAAVEEDILTVGGVFGPVYRPGQIALSHADTKEHLISYHENVHVL